MIKKSFMMAATLTLLAVSPMLLSGCGTAMINPGNVGVKTDWGVVDNTLMDPGFHTFSPFGSDVQSYNLKQNIVAETASPLTSDLQAIETEFKIQYKIPRGQVMNLFKGVNGDPYDNLVKPQVQEAIRQVVSAYKADYVIGHVDEIKSQVLAHVQKSLNSRVDVIDIQFTHVGLPRQLQDAINEKQKMEIQAKAKLFELEKEKKEAEITIVKAQAKAAEIRLQNQALSNSPHYISKLWIEKWHGEVPQIITGNGTGMMFQMPFPSKK